MVTCQIHSEVELGIAQPLYLPGRKLEISKQCKCGAIPRVNLEFADSKYIRHIKSEKKHSTVKREFFLGLSKESCIHPLVVMMHLPLQLQKEVDSIVLRDGIFA